MPKFNIIRLLLSFYLSFFAATFSISLACAFLLLRLGPPALVILVWFKIITLGIIVLYMNSYKHKEFFYYRNLGISKMKLWVYSLSSDLAIFIFLLILTVNLA